MRGVSGSAAMIAVLIVASALLVYSLARLAPQERPSTPEDASGQAAEAAAAKCEELRALPADAPELRVETGSASSLYAQPSDLLLRDVPGYVAPEWVLEWTVEASRHVGARWVRAVGGERYDVKVVTVRVKSARPGGSAPVLAFGRESALARMSFWVPAPVPAKPDAR